MSECSRLKTTRIRELNDRLRRDNVGGRIVITSGIAALDSDVMSRVLAAVAEFNDFDDDNDPWAEHDCATLTVSGHRVLFKIDYYDRQLQYHSSDASDPAVTTRLLTVMLAEEY